MPSPVLSHPADTPVALNGAERRVHRRLSASELRGLVTARMKYGSEVKLIDLSVGGALVEVPGKLSADTSVVFEFAGPGSTVLVPSRALRVHSLSHLDDSGRYEGAFAFRRPLALTDLLKEPAAKWHKIVARCRDGKIVQGYTRDFSATRRGMTVSPTPFGDASRELALSEVDAVFFMREGPRTTVEAGGGQTPGRRVAVTLTDGEIITGTTWNYRRDGNGFFLHPSDEGNTLRVFVSPWAVRSMKFL